MKKTAIINLQYTFDEVKDLLFDMIGCDHNIAINEVIADAELKTIVFKGTEDTSSTRRHTAAAPLEELFGVSLTVNSKSSGKKVKPNLTAYLKKLYDEPNIRIPYSKIRELCDRDGYGQNRSDKEIKGIMYAAGIRQVDPGIYAYVQKVKPPKVVRVEAV